MEYRRYFNEVLSVLSQGEGWQEESDIRNRVNQGRWFWQSWYTLSFAELLEEMVKEGLIQRDASYHTYQGTVVRVNLYRISPTLREYQTLKFGTER